MEFKERQFSKRHPPLTCAIFILYGENIPYRTTGAAIITRDGSVFFGVSICSPMDAFVKTVGRAKAVGRAFSRYLHSVGATFNTATLTEGKLSKEESDGLKAALLVEMRVAQYKAQRDAKLYA